jgi:hypothetical protein
MKRALLTSAQSWAELRALIDTNWDRLIVHFPAAYDLYEVLSSLAGGSLFEPSLERVDGVTSRMVSDDDRDRKRVGAHQKCFFKSFASMF